MKKRLAHLSQKAVALLLTVVLVMGMIPTALVGAAEVETLSINENMPVNTLQLSVGADQTVSVVVNKAAYYYLIIEDSDISVMFSGKEYPATDGKVQVFLNKNQQSVPFYVINHASSDKNLKLKFRRYDGHKQMPYELESMSSFTVEQQAVFANIGNENGTYYSWTASADGVVKMSGKVTDNSGIDAHIIITQTTAKGEKTLESTNGSIVVDVAQGDKLSIRIIAHAVGNMLAPNATIAITASFIEAGAEIPSQPTEPTDPPTEPSKPSTEPTDPPTEPSKPSTEPTDPPTEPSKPTTEPSTEPSEPSTEPSESEHICYVDGYSDVVLTKWYHEALDYMVSNGYMNGMSNTKMEPNGNLTRAQWAKLLYEIAGKPSVSGLSHPFTDVPAGKWYTDPVIWAYNEGIVKGVSETVFGPTSQITREQMATMLYRYAGSPAVNGGLYAFTDGSSVGNFAKDAMVWATQNGIINGVGGNKLDPKGKATRAQAAKILYEYDK